jgi:tetratricopeptide (TPR) repeat protein
VAIERPPTADLTAFNLYSRAKNLLLVVTYSSNGRANLLKAADLLNEAIAHDRTFFQAYSQLAWTHDHLYRSGFDRTPARLALAEAAIQVAFRLRPGAGEAHLARAGHLYRGYDDYDGTLAELEAARQSLPNDPRIFELKGYVERRRPGGNQEEALRNLERAIEIDPRNVFTLQQIAISCDLLRRYAKERAVLNHALAIEPNDVETSVARGHVELDWKADSQPLHQIIQSIRTKDPGLMPSIAGEWLICALAERDPTAAKDALVALGENPLIDAVVNLNPRLMEGVLAHMTSDDKKASDAFTAAHAEQEKIVQAQPDYGPALCVLGLIDAALGRKEEALREGRHAVEILPVEKDALDGPQMIKYLAMIAAWVGDKDLACEQLATGVRYPSTLSYGQLKLLPFWDPLRGDPRFEKIVASLAPKG